ncbi:DUF4126 domain-containing protein [Nocardioides bizhenqiangii]|uniref:DUF4126 domain-containing protein n=1 Tax=Nocardioides bizhenqiangii TaxID=3095076 RepID=A0ABZ0ZPE7_9ACTN|nr:DUF4126 domain-containing protein [Nocardioides sp. HM61]WQQ25699.1 DUF4126 domain-containing protein [Nocardioides sp. HM61]
MESLALTFSSGWASGVNAYLVVLVLGIADRVSDFAQIPDELGSWEVLTVAALMYAFEFVADKVPYVDSAWDVISTVIRPLVGGTIGVLLAGDSTEISGLLGGSVGGASALASHAVKAGSRLAVNTSPEPASNIALSIGEDVVVLALVWFAIEHPYIAAAIAGVLLLVGLVVLYFAIRLIRSGWRRFKAWRQRRRARERPRSAAG